MRIPIQDRNVAGAMNHRHFLTTTSQALQRVFLDPFLSQSALYSRSVHEHKYIPSLRSRCSVPLQYVSNQHRNASVAHGRSRTASIGDLKDNQPSLGRQPRDEEIRSFRVHLVRAEDGRLTEPMPTYEVLRLRQVDEKGRPTQYLQQVAPMSAQEGRMYPICKILDKKAVLQSEATKRKVQKEGKVQTKRLEINWIVSDNDLSYRLDRLKEFLEKGWKVEILFGAKRKGWMGRRDPSKEEVERVLERIRATVKEVDGAKEWRDFQGVEGGDAMMHLDGKAKK